MPSSSTRMYQTPFEVNFRFFLVVPVTSAAPDHHRLVNASKTTTPFLGPALLCAGALTACTSSQSEEPEPSSFREESVLEIAVHGQCLAEGVSLSLPTTADHPPDPGLEVEWTVVEGPSEGCLVGAGSFARLAVSEPGTYLVEAVIAGSEEVGMAEVVVESCNDDEEGGEEEEGEGLACLGSIAVPGGATLDPEVYGSACECPPVEPADTDGDGVLDTDDACAGTVLSSVASGCSVAQLVANPGALTRSLTEAASEVETEINALVETEGLDSLAEAAAMATMTGEQLRGLELLVEQGNACGALKWLGAAQDSAVTTAASLAGSSDAISAHAASVYEPDEEGTAGTAFMVRVHGIRSQAQALVDAFDGPVESLANLCGQVESDVEWVASVTGTPDARGVIQLDEGTYATLPAGAVPVAEGMTVALSGHSIGDTLVATGVEVVDGVAGYVEPQPLLPCLQLGYAPPIQPFDPGQPAAVVHDIAGYLRGDWPQPGTVHLEEGGRLAAVEYGCEEEFGLDRGLRIIAEYDDGSQIQVAASLGANDEPVPIDWYRSGSPLAGLEVELVEQDCSSTVPCITNLEPTENYPVRRVAQGSACELEFDREIFELHQTSPAYYQRAVLDGAEDTSGFPSLLANTTYTAHAQGYRAEQQQIGSILHQWSTANIEYAIAEGDGIAVYDAPLDTSGSSFADTGAVPGSPVRWPHVVGQDGPYDFAYSCDVPTLIRDRIADCGAFPALVDSYYALPFGFLQGWLEVTQGNMSVPGRSHAVGSLGQYAFDFDLPLTSFVLAARPGRVVTVFEGEWRGEPSCLDMLQAGVPWCSTEPNLIPPVASQEPEGGWGCVPVGNTVIVQHSDGTFGIYVHFNVAGVVVEVGDQVERGDILGLSGTTGCSTGPHLHFEQQSFNTPPGATEQMTFGGFYTPVWPPQPQYQACWNPAEGSMVQSTLL